MPTTVDLKHHIVNIVNDGAPNAANKTKKGVFIPGTDEAQIRANVARFLEVAKARGWEKPRLVIFAHGGTVEPEVAMHYFSERQINAFLDLGIYPLAVIWNCGILETLANAFADKADVLKDALGLNKHLMDGRAGATVETDPYRVNDAAVEMVAYFPVTSLYREWSTNSERSRPTRRAGTLRRVASHECSDGRLSAC